MISFAYSIRETMFETYSVFEPKVNQIWVKMNLI